MVPFPRRLAALLQKLGGASRWLRHGLGWIAPVTVLIVASLMVSISILPLSSFVAWEVNGAGAERMGELRRTRGAPRWTAAVVVPDDRITSHCHHLD